MFRRGTYSMLSWSKWSEVRLDEHKSYWLVVWSIHSPFLLLMTDVLAFLVQHCLVCWTVCWYSYVCTFWHGQGVHNRPGNRHLFAVLEYHSCADLNSMCVGSFYFSDISGSWTPHCLCSLSTFWQRRCNHSLLYMHAFKGQASERCNFLTL